MTLDEFYSDFKIRKLQANEVISSFNCGDEDLNDFILNDATVYKEALLAITYIVENKADNKVYGYFSLANDRVGMTDFPDKTEFNRFRKHKFVNEKRLKSYPATKICRLGISENLKGQNIGTYLIDYIKTLCFVENRSGCRFLTVDAYSEAINFYIKNKFSRLCSNNEDDRRTQLLFFDLHDLS